MEERVAQTRLSHEGEAFGSVMQLIKQISAIYYLSELIYELLRVP